MAPYGLWPSHKSPCSRASSSPEKVALWITGENQLQPKIPKALPQTPPQRSAKWQIPRSVPWGWLPDRRCGLCGLHAVAQESTDPTGPDWARLGPTRPMAWRSVYGPPCLQRMCLSKSPPTQSSRTFHSAQMHMLKSLDGSWQPRNVYVGGWSGLYNISHHLAINHLQACRIYFSCPSRPAGSRDPDQVEVWFVLKSLVQHQHIWVVCPDKPRKNMAGTSFLAESLNCHWSNLWAALKDTQVVWTLCATWSCYQSYKYHCHYCCYSCCS